MNAVESLRSSLIVDSATPTTRQSTTQWSMVFDVPDISKWQKDVLIRLLELIRLPKNWDSYGSEPPRQSVANLTWIILGTLELEHLPTPFIAPVSGGGLQIEWQIGNRGLELEILIDGLVNYLKTEGAESIEEGQLEFVEEGQLEIAKVSVQHLISWLISTESKEQAA